MATLNQENGSLVPKDTVNGINKHANLQVAVHSFDPDASPAQKGAVAGKGKEMLRDIRQRPDGQGEKEIAVDTGHSNIVPTITVEDADTVKHDGESTARVPSTPAPQMVPGDISTGPAPDIPPWFQTGWRAVSGIDRPPEGEEEKQKSILDLFLAEQYYGTWYHNAALICFAVFASHFLTRFHFGWGWLFIVLAVCNTYYTTSMARVRRCARDEVQRELVKLRLASEHESADWINNFLDRFWLIYEPVLSQTIISSVDQILSTNTPAFLDSLRLATFTLGTKAPRIDRVRTFPKTPEDIIMMDWGFSFTPNDIEDMTPRQAAKKVNPKIVLSVRVGKGLALATIPILLEDITFSGMMRIRMKLMTNFPHVQVVDLCFLEPPVIDYVLKPLGGETFGIDIANIPGLSGFIREMTHATLGPMMYDPNLFTLNLEQLLSGTPLDTAIGVLQVTIDSARGIKGDKIGGGIPDPYVTLSISNREQLARTKYKHNTHNPTWMETKFVLVNSLTETLTLNLFDYNDHRKDTPLGSANFEMSKLHEDATQEGLESTILKDGKDRGLLRYDVSFYPVLTATSVEGKNELPETTVGIVRLTIHQAKDLDVTKSLAGDLNPLAKVYLANGPIAAHTTRRFKHTNNPIWESATEFLCSDKASSVITVKVIDDRDFMKDPVVGYLSIRLGDLLDAKKVAGKDWWMLSGCKSGKLRMSAEWKPLNMAGSLQGADKYTPPIGVVRLWLEKATDVKNVEAALGGKSDPYVRVQINNVTKSRTEVINNNLNPVWDQIIYIPVHSLKETLLMECMDYQHLTKDRSLGSVELRVSDLAKESEDMRYPYDSTGTKECADPIRIGNVHKGRLHYIAQFVPALALKGIKFEGGVNELQRTAKRPDNGSISSASSVSSSLSDEPGTAIPAGITVKRPVDEAFEKTHVRNDTADTMDSLRHVSTSNIKNEEAEDRLVQMSKEELLREQSGIIVFNVISGRLAKKGRLEVLLDDGYWPAFTTIKSRSTNAQWEHVGEGFVKELDFGRVWLRLNENDEGEKDDIIAEWKGDAKAFLESTMDGPRKYTLMDGDDNHVSVVEIESRYVPVPVKLDSRESVNNQGILHVELIDGREIRGVDRGGKSDPFAVFSLNGQKVFKSQTKKKTLTPEWKESFVVSVFSRVKADFSVEIFDWNQIEQAKSLGTANINVVDIEPFQAVELTVNLTTPKHGEKGQIRVRLMFQPEIIAKSRKNTSTFSAAGRAMTTIGSLPVDAGKGVLHGVTGVFKKERDFGKEHKEEDGQHAISDYPTGQASQPIEPSVSLEGGGSVTFPISTASVAGNNVIGPREPGTLRVTVLQAKDLFPTDIKPYVVLRVGIEERKTKHASKTSTPEWNESFNFPAGALTPKLFAWVYDHKTLGRDKLLGEAEIDIWRHIQPMTIPSAEVSSELREGQGLLRVRLEFDVDSGLILHGTSIASVERTQSIASPSRFSLRSRRPDHRDDDRD